MPNGANLKLMDQKNTLLAKLIWSYLKVSYLYLVIIVKVLTHGIHAMDLVQFPTAVSSGL